MNAPSDTSASLAPGAQRVERPSGFGCFLRVALHAGLEQSPPDFLCSLESHIRQRSLVRWQISTELSQSRRARDPMTYRRVGRERPLR
jgi:hypothetical protein